MGSCLIAGCHHISLAHGAQQRSLEFGVDLLPQLADVTSTHWSAVEMIVPNILEKHGSGDDLTGMTHQVLEQF